MRNITKRKEMMKLFCFILVCCSGMLNASGLFAQCTVNTYGPYPATVYTPISCLGAFETIASDCFAGEYSVVGVTLGQTYTFKSSNASDYVTISTGAAVGTAVAFGTGSVTWTSTVTGNVRFWLHTSSACGSQAANRSRIVSCGTAPANDAEVTVIYSLGKLPRVFGNNHVVQAIIKNNGTNAIASLDVTLAITGANSFTNIKTISLGVGAQQVVSFDPFTPTDTGANIITVTLPSDDILTNNSKIWNQNVTLNLFSYKNPNVSNQPGGVGFTGATGDFVAGFTTSTAGAINEVKVDFSTAGQPYKVGIWDATGTGDAPGTLLWESAGLTSVLGTAFIPVPNITVNGSYFVGVRQTGTTNVAFSYQIESPLRVKKFYYTSPTGSTTWTDLSATNVFRFSIEPQFFVPQLPNCPTTFLPADAAVINPNSITSLGWASGGGGATNYDVYFGTSSNPPLIGNTTGVMHPVSLQPNTTYYWSVKANNAYGSSNGCVVNSFTTSTAVSNDNPNTAIVLDLGAGCAGAIYTTVDASFTPGEPFPSCSGAASNPVWFSFIAPASGAVKVSTDVGTGGTLLDTKVALFEATNVNDYSTFNIISCDEDGGSTITDNSVLYATGLVAGNTYYIAVDKYISTTVNGTFCLTVDELNSSMLSSTNTCNSTYQTPFGSTAYSGWVPLLDGDSKLIALVRNTAGGSVGAYAVKQNINTAAVRADENGKYYMDRNFSINNATATNVDVRLFFLNTELAALAAADPSVTLNNLGITHQSGTTCANDYSAGSGTNTIINLSGAGNLGTISYVQFNTPSFSNFYLAGGGVPLPIVIKSIAAKNIGKSNQINWTTAEEHKGDYFELERSHDGRIFNFLAKVAANEKPSDYIYYDKSPLEKVNYYRLKLLSRDGKATYSQTVQAKLSINGMSVEAYPNPANKSVTIKVHGSENGDVTLSDVSGRVVYQTKMKGAELQIDMSNLSNGFYLMRYTDGNFNEVIKVNKQ